ncbi:response regulator transcription factor [Paenibacillus beijingensis]|uniref:AraC family transcriptional regulator n=1 Tax=Paenibacillus beijingensis TaxID=1126833 RepID=A0A0D5NPP6_9BACL|nr:response regulator [Paenibacillus beijingensis]AJY76987.1 hypothetical protein VN24_23555 [Paenibacillus beijingensis]
MLKVVIVDDEPIIRMGIKASILWERLSLELAGEYSNGAEAFKSMEQSAADILITDIKMPVMDGLELTKRTRELSPATQVILISSYNDFEFVRQGIVLGATDYILKPTMEPEELNDVIGRCVRNIQRETDIKGKLDRFRKNEHELDRKQLEQDIKRILSQEQNDAQLSPKHADRFREGYVLVRAVIDKADALQMKSGNLHVSMLLDELKERFYALQPEGVAFVSGEAELVMLFTGRGGGSDRITAVKEELEREGALELTFICTEEHEPKRWLSSYERTSHIYSRRFFDGSGGLYRILPDGEVRLEKRRFPQAMQTGETSLPFQDQVRQWAKLKYDAQRVKNEACELFSSLFVRRLEPGVLLEYYNQLVKAETLDGLAETLESGIRECEDQQAFMEKVSSNQLAVNKAMDFIRERYTQEITLQMVADHVHISKNYFSVLFKKQTSYNFIDYMIQLRVDRAKELLLDKTNKIYEIAERTGFNDVKYFSKLFKKITGCTPVEYRERSLQQI